MSVWLDRGAQFDGTRESFCAIVADLPDKWRGKCCYLPESPTCAGKMMIPTLEGMHYADKNDWILVGVKDEVYPCKPDIFAETYEVIT